MFWDFLSFIVSKIVFFCSSIGGDCFPKPLSSEDEAKYLTAFREKGDQKAKEMLIKHNLRLVAHIAKKYQGAEDSDDLISVGSIGLIKAINTYVPGKGTQLATYTARCIENEILMLLRANKKHKNNVSLYDTIGQDKDGNELNVIDLLSEQEDSVLIKVENRLLKQKFLAVMKECLTPREFKIICLRYGLKGGRPLAQREVAVLLKISRSYISRIEKKAIEKLKAEVKRREFFVD
ncbi:MAG: RNA polymerase sporulation sigma factor SigK [Clostridia bacterium]|nr:RNA polymerase sporulation sigma factor SigK [Clostridia bacterium]